jgi:hypothetical protein
MKPSVQTLVPPKKKKKTPNKQTNKKTPKRRVRHTPVVPATREAEAGESLEPRS